MFLTEKHYYGTGVTDANLQIGMRNFRDTPVNAYFEDDPGAPTNNEDRVGYLTQYYYDWRMRPVWVQRNKAAVDNDPPDPFGPQPELIGDPLTHTVTWYDNLDRPSMLLSKVLQAKSTRASWALGVRCRLHRRFWGTRSSPFPLPKTS
jgi:hypothetical protein